MHQQDIREIKYKDIADFVALCNEKEYRAKQIYEWLWKKGARSFEDMSNLSKELRKELEKKYTFFSCQIDENHIQKSRDKTVKFSLKLHDGEYVETVLIPSKERVTVCISTQVGCPLGCKFCATGKMQFKRNLTAGEIFDQVTLMRDQAKELYKSSLSNIVIMGMGEPLLNYENTMKAIDKITSVDGLGISPQRITLSTSGITDKIKQLANDDAKFQLAISLHTVNDAKRTHLMPINKSHSIQMLTDAVKYYHKKTKNRVTFEYLLIKDFNDSLSDAKELAIFCKSFPVKINLIEYNEVPGIPYKKASTENTVAFEEFLKSKNIIVNLRKSKGGDIAAACGQLAGKLK